MRMLPPAFFFLVCLPGPVVDGHVPVLAVSVWNQCAAADAPPKELPRAEERPDRDARYRKLLVDFQRFQAIWRQQPDNLPALQRELERLQQHVDGLPEKPGGRPASKKPGQTSLPTQPGSSSPPSKPVKPSQEPTPEEILRERIKATEGRYLTGLPLGAEPIAEKSLTGVADDWVAAQAKLAAERLTRIGKNLKGSPNRKAVDRALQELELILEAIDEPPASKPKVAPTRPGP